MSAPVAVNTADGTCWTRRGEKRDGEALYAPEGVCNCPPFVMATLAELAEHGIVGSADVLPAPPGPEPDEPIRTIEAALAALGPLPESQRPEHGPLWSLLDWSLWGAGMGDLFREALADRMLAAIPERGRAHAEALMAEFIERRRIEKTGVTVYQEQRDEVEKLRARVAELEAAAKEIQRLHTDSPMGPCPVCIDADAMVQGDDYTLPYPCPTARLAGAKDCDPPSQREDPCHPCGCPKRFDRHADGCPTLAAAEGGDVR